MLRALLLSMLISLSFCKAYALDNFPLPIAEFLNKQGPIVFGRFFHGSLPQKQIVVHYCIDEGMKGGKNEGANNAANIHCALVLFNKSQKGQWSYGDKVEIGQGEVKTFTDGMVSGETLSYADNDANCCPSIKTSIRLFTRRGRFDRSNK